MWIYRKSSGAGRQVRATVESPRGTGLSRNTVHKYLSAAKAGGIARDGAVPSDDQLGRLAVMGQPCMVRRDATDRSNLG